MNVGKEMARLQKSTTRDLQRQYAEVFGEPTKAAHKAWLIKRILWRMRANAEDLSERARRRAAELANDADLRLSCPVVVGL